MLGILSGLLRRILGGFWSDIPIIKQRGVQWILCALLYAPVIYFRTYHTYLADMLPHWLFVVLSTFSLIYAETKGHFPGFKCGTESRKYIEEEVAKGRKIPFKRIIDWFGKIRGYEEYGREWCFWQLILCKTVCLTPVILLIGIQYLFIGLCVAFVYNACYWVELKPYKKLLVTPTNWGEFWQGLLYFQGLF